MPVNNLKQYKFYIDQMSKKLILGKSLSREDCESLINIADSLLAEVNVLRSTEEALFQHMFTRKKGEFLNETGK